MSRARPMLRADTSSEGVGVCTECSGSQPHWPNVELGEATIQIADGPDATVAELVAQSMSANSQPEPPPEGGITTRDWSVDKLLDRYSERFRSVRRVSALTLSQKELEDEIARFEKEGRPLIIEGYHRKEEWPTERFGVDWLCRHGPEDVRTRNVRDWTDGTMKMNEFIEYCRKTSPHGTVAESSRLYGKDVDCPTEWRDWLNHSGILPPMLLEEDAENFMNRLPTSDRVETLMCYLGIGDTFTPAHKDLCASTGHNLMCYTENSGSSFWFMTESSAAPNVMKYFQSVGQELDLETHAMSLDEFARAPFTVYIAEQKLGDLVLVPPRSCHQVVNNGGLTIKASWSRMTLGGLKTALYHELPIYRRVCRSETYRVKSIIYQSLQYYTQILQANWSAVQERNFSSPLDAGSKSRSPSSPSRDTMSGSRKSGTILDGPATADKQKSIQTLQELLKLFDDILGEEYHPQHAALSRVSPPDPDYQHSWHYTCDFCGCDIFQSFFECKHCGITDSQQEKGTGDGIILCTSCYVEGRTCKCTRMDPAQRFSFDALVEQRNRASRVLEELAPGEGPAQLSLDISSRKSPFNKDANSLSVLRAAMALQKIRKKQANSRDARVCTDRRERSSHHAPALSVVPCKRCHGSLCLEHLLVLGIHAASVFLERSKDDPLHDRWHDFHRRKKTDLIRENRANNAVATGSPLALEDRLLIAAAEFKVCRPVKERWVKLGFYDSHVQVLNVSHKFKKVPVRRPNNPLSGPSTSGSPLTELAVTPEPEDISAPTHLVKNMLICASSDSGNVSASPVAGTSASPENDSHATRQRTPRSRSLLDCVEIPPLKRKSTVPLAEPRPSKKVKVLNAGATQSPSVCAKAVGSLRIRLTYVEARTTAFHE
ncbi:hypothetical protein OE88DRAFT_1805491 [Heliocybe sulcata]|uniref:JmjC domain-containing protein n=1 Tax=Heliocybe sulcata TaxID=5364 RepID=A0A5C3NBA9_9AGAM|nr:hypothetical protein OE88DRAFT_1805491 [Heliocybe sulcata]